MAKKSDNSRKLSSLSLATWIVAIVGLAVVVAIFMLARPKTDLASELTGEANPAGILIPTNVTSYKGAIAQINENEIFIHALSQDNYLTENRTIRVLVGPETEIVRLVLSGGEPVEEEIVDFSYFEQLQTVRAYAEGNVRGKTEYTATRIEVIE